MEIKVIPYGRIDQGAKQRLGIIAWFLADMASQGKTVTLVCPSLRPAHVLELETALDLPVLSSHNFSFAHVTTDCIAVIDGDVIDDRTIARLKHLRKDVYLIVPTGALPQAPAGAGIDEVLHGATFVPGLADDEDQPKTFACNHNAPTCANCASMVMQWHADRRERALAQAS